MGIIKLILLLRIIFLKGVLIELEELAGGKVINFEDKTK